MKKKYIERHECDKEKIDPLDDIPHVDKYGNPLSPYEWQRELKVQRNEARLYKLGLLKKPSEHSKEKKKRDKTVRVMRAFPSCKSLV